MWRRRHTLTLISPTTAGHVTNIDIPCERQLVPSWLHPKAHRRYVLGTNKSVSAMRGLLCLWQSFRGCTCITRGGVSNDVNAGSLAVWLAHHLSNKLHHM